MIEYGETLHGKLFGKEFETFRLPEHEDEELKKLVEKVIGNNEPF